MIPILYKADETEFRTNGLGRLSNALSCTVKEERNGSYELSMVYPVNGIHYSDIANGMLILAQPSQGTDPEPFEIYMITRPMNGKVQIKAEHISYRMKYIPVTAFTANDVKSALSGLTSHAVCSCPFTFDTDKSANGAFEVEQPSTMRSLLAENEGSIIDVYDGEWEFTRFKAFLHKARGQDNGVTIRYGKNLTSLEQEENIEEMYSGIYPYWTNDDSMVEIPERVLKTSVADKIPYDKVLAVDFSSELEQTEVTNNWTETKTELDPSTSRIKTTTEEKSETIKINPSADSLRQVAQAYIRNNNLDTPQVSFKIAFVDLWQSADYQNMSAIEQVHLCDTVTVQFPQLGVSATSKVTETDYDVLNEKYTSIQIGNSKPTLNDFVNKSLRVRRAGLSGAIEEAQENDKRLKELERQAQLAKYNQSGSKTLTLSNSTDAVLFTMDELDTLFGLVQGTCNNTNTIAMCVNADTTNNTAVSGTIYNDKAWHAIFSQLVNGSVLVNYTVRYTGG